MQDLERIWGSEYGRISRFILKNGRYPISQCLESFREVCIKNYGLDPAHFYTAPGLAWKACLKKTGIRLKLLQDPDMLLMFERGIRGGITQSVHRYAAANNPYMKEYDSNKPTIFSISMLITYMAGQCRNHYQL